jgi:hypothetical protein
MSRMRMALSALPELSPPVGEWEAIRARLGHRTAGLRARALPFPVRLRPAWAAAVVALFAAGLGVGRLLSPGADPVRQDGADPGGTSSREVPALLADGADRGPTEAYVRTAAGLQELRSQGPTGGEVAGDPAAAAERLMRLDALIEASREALRSAPADPVLNNFLFDVVDEREAVAGQLDRALRLTSAEY